MFNTIKIVYKMKTSNVDLQSAAIPKKHNKQMKYMVHGYNRKSNCILSLYTQLKIVSHSLPSVIHGQRPAAPQRAECIVEMDSVLRACSYETNKCIQWFSSFCVAQIIWIIGTSVRTHSTHLCSILMFTSLTTTIECYIRDVALR